MAILWLDGFEGGSVDNTEMQQYITRRYSSSSVASYLKGTIGVFQGLSVFMYNDKYCQVDIDNTQTIIVGFHFKCNDVSVSNNDGLLRFYDSGSLQCELQLTNTGELRLTRGTTNQLAVTTTLGLTDGQWIFIELKLTIDNSGSYELKVNGSTLVSGSADTQATANAYTNEIRLLGDFLTSACMFYFDNFYIVDTIGIENNDFLGEINILKILPDADYLQGWTRSTGSDNYTLVDDTFTDDDTTYVESTISSARDWYEYEDVAEDFNIIAICTCTEAKESDAIDYTLITIVSTESDDTPQAITSSYLIYSRIIEDWTEAILNTTKIGVKVG